MSLSQNHQPGPVALVGIAFSALVTGCSGTLIALLAFAAQVKVLRAEARSPLFIAVALLGGSLAAAIWSTLVGYLSELFMANGRDNNMVWWVAFALAVLAALLFTLGLGFGGFTLVQQLS